MYRPAISCLQDYLYDVSYDNIDYVYAYEWFRRHTPVISGACSTVRKGNLIGRNLDWTYDESAEFIVHTDGVVGVANAIPGLTDAFVKSGEDSELYKIVPFMLSDGMNKYGLVVSTLVVPTDNGDNSVVHPLGTPAHVMCTLMLPRYMLDHFRTARGAVAYFKYSITLYHPKTLQDQKYDQHFVIADGTDTYCMEFINGMYVVKDISSKPFVTNFHLFGVTFNDDGSVYTPATGKASVNGITDNGSGLERYNFINAAYKRVRNAYDMERLMAALSYTRAYQSSENVAVPRWDTEFVGNGRTVDTPTAGYDAVQQLAAEEYNRRDRSTGTTWHTVHSVVYDVQDKKLVLHSQENYDTQWEVSVMAEQTHIQRLRGNTAKNDVYTGLNGETTINTDSHSVRIHDGLKRGGYGTIDSAHYDGDLPATVPTDLRTGAHVTQGTGHLDGGISTTAESLAGNGLIASGGALDVDVDNLAGDGLLSTGDALAVDLDTLDGRYVKTTGNETIDGTKTFSSSPLVPTADAGDSSTKSASTAFVAGELAPIKGQIGNLKVAPRDMTFYVRKSGNDGNNGLTEGTAFLTVGRAVEEVKTWYFGSYACIIDIGSGTFLESSISLPNVHIVGKRPTIRGNNTIISVGTSFATVISVSTSGANWLIRDLELNKDNTEHWSTILEVLNNTTVYIVNVKLTGNAFHGIQTQNSLLGIGNGCEISINGHCAIYVGMSGRLIHQADLVINSTISQKVSYNPSAVIWVAGGVAWIITKINGTTTGKRYFVTYNGTLNVGGRGANDIPGSSAGSVENGGIYA